MITVEGSEPGVGKFTIIIVNTTTLVEEILSPVPLPEQWDQESTSYLMGLSFEKEGSVGGPIRNVRFYIEGVGQVYPSLKQMMEIAASMTARRAREYLSEAAHFVAVNVVLDTK